MYMSHLCANCDRELEVGKYHTLKNSLIPQSMDICCDCVSKIIKEIRERRDKRRSFPVVLHESELVPPRTTPVMKSAQPLGDRPSEGDW